MLLIILYTIASIVGAFLFIALITKREMSLTSEVIINRSQADVFNYIKHIKNQEYYSKWVMADPNSKITYTGVDGTVGFKAAWNSEMKNVGVGEQEITKITDGVGYDVILRFEKPFKGISYANARTEALSANQTKVITTFSSTTPFPMNLMSAMMKGMLLKDMNENSANLKKVLEAK
ncbi:MAG: SRPBCC family protein [Bacteroidetes bacterium]|nr:SRPBCC family protein [Bacteroidota bacterium]